MIPPLPWPFSLQPPILNRKHIPKHPRLDHTLSEKFSTISGSRPQLLTSSVHSLPLSLEFELLGAAAIGLVELPGAVNRPVAEVTASTESEGARGQRVVEEIAN
jgi:hypothetical protein